MNSLTHIHLSYHRLWRLRLLVRLLIGELLLRHLLNLLLLLLRILLLTLARNWWLLVKETVVDFHLSLLLRIDVANLLLMRRVDLVTLSSSTTSFRGVHLYKVVLVACVSGCQFYLA